MSEVRMCDTCGRVFSTLEDDWAYSNTQIRKRGDDGRLRHEDVELHTCANCVNGITKGAELHRAALEAPKTINLPDDKCEHDWTLNTEGTMVWCQKCDSVRPVVK